MASFVVNFHIKTPAMWQRHFLGKRMTITKAIYNALRNIELKKLNELEQDNEYLLVIKKKYSEWTLDDRLLVRNKRKEYKLTRLDFIKDVKPIYKFYKDGYSSQMSQSVAKRLWNAFNKYFYGNGDEIHEMYKCDSFESESNTNGIIFKDNKIRVLKHEFELDINYDDYIKEALKNKVSYVRIIKMVGKTTDRYYAQVIFSGTPPKKKRINRNGEVGLDIGVSTLALSSNTKVYIDELAKDVVPMKKELKRIERKLERSRRQTNPNNYNTNGTIKDKSYKWYKSKHYKKLARKKRYLNAKIQRKRKESHELLANMVLSLGDTFHLEKMYFKDLQERKKEETKVKADGKCEKKKKYGSSINIHSPASFVSILKRKAYYRALVIDEVDTKTVKASQYNHVTRKYEKKELSVRRFFVGNNEVQRDLYSAYLLMNTKNNIIDQEKCEKNFNRFLELQQLEISRLQTQKNISCIGY